MSSDTNIERHNVTLYLLRNEASKCIDFLKTVFNAEVIYGPEYREDGSFMHSEIKKEFGSKYQAFCRIGGAQKKS